MTLFDRLRLNRLRPAASVVVALAAWLFVQPGNLWADGRPESARVAQSREAERALPLQGGVNFRELGGYPTTDGRRVRWGMLYRSGSMSALTAADYEYLSTLNIKVLADFRSTEERLREPTRWPDGKNEPARLERDYQLEFGEVLAVMRDAPSAEAARAAFASFYRRLPEQFAVQYRQMFAELLAGRAPLAFNCSAGKDRTGVAAALILTALGVPREIVTDDYLLSNRYYKPKPISANDSADPAAQMFSRLPPDVVQVFMGVEAEFLDAAFAGMIEQHGSIDGYLEKVMGLSRADRERLRQLYTDPAGR